MPVTLDPNINSLSDPLPLSDVIGCDFNEVFPDEIIQKIFFTLKDSELGRCHRVCKRWKVLASDEVFLKTRYPEAAFGEDKWKAIGKIGKVPRLPNNINEILEGPCPIYEGKKIKDTHILAYKPKQVNVQPLTVNNIGTLFPIQGNATGYRNIWSEIITEHGNTPVEKEEWLLMTKDVLPGSRNKSYTEQQTLVKNLSEKAQAEYQVPKLIDAITCIFAEYASSGTRLYSTDPWTYTRCQEKIRGYQSIVGGFAPAGLIVDNYFVGDDIGVGALRKF